MSNAAKFEVPGAGDDGKAYTYNETGDSHVLTDLAGLYQPLDSDLTAIAALTTTSTGRSLLAAADAAAIRTIAGAEVSGAAASAVSAHDADTSVHGIADTSALLDTGDIGVSVQGYSSVLAATTASFTTADETKLDGIEALADVTDETNVVAALSGATLTDVGTPASGDKILLLDASDADNLKTAAFSTFGGGGGAAEQFQAVPAVGEFFSTQWANGNSNATKTHERIYLMPIWVPVDMTVDTIGINTNTTAATSVVRLGIYDASASNRPDSLVLDAGTVDVSSGTGLKNITISQALTKGLYYLATCTQGSSAVQIRYTNYIAGFGNMTTTQNNLTSPVVSFLGDSGVSGALPSTITISYTSSGDNGVPIVMLKRSA